MDIVNVLFKQHPPKEEEKRKIFRKTTGCKKKLEDVILNVINKRFHNLTGAWNHLCVYFLYLL